MWWAEFFTVEEKSTSLVCLISQAHRFPVTPSHRGISFGKLGDAQTLRRYHFLKFLSTPLSISSNYLKNTTPRTRACCVLIEEIENKIDDKILFSFHFLPIFFLPSPFFSIICIARWCICRGDPIKPRLKPSGAQWRIDLTPIVYRMASHFPLFYEPVWQCFISLFPTLRRSLVSCRRGRS